MTDRRKARRRRMPYVRGGVLEVAGRSHVVAVADLSPEGAFLQTKVEVKAGQAVKLRMVLPRDGHEVGLPCVVVRRSDRFDPKSGQPAGLAVRFQGLTGAAVRRVEEFAMEGFLPTVEPTPHEHIEYRILERAAVAESELNQLGLDGWELTAALPAKAGLRLVLLRRL